MAAVLSFGTLLAIAVLPLPIRIGGGVIAAVVIGGVPQLAGRRALGKEGWITRLIRDVSGIAVLAPVLLGGVSPTLPVRLRLAAVFAVAVLVSMDGLRTERLSIPATILFGAPGRLRRARRRSHPGRQQRTRGVSRGDPAGALVRRPRCRRRLVGPVRNRELIAEYALFVVAASPA